MESGLLITFKKFPRYYSRLPHTGKKAPDYICKLTVTLSFTKPQAFSDLETFGPGDSLAKINFQLF